MCKRLVHPKRKLFLGSPQMAASSQTGDGRPVKVIDHIYIGDRNAAKVFVLLQSSC